MVYDLTCDWCGKPFRKYRKDKHNFCNRACLAAFSSKSINPSGYQSLKNYENISHNMTSICQKMNPGRMTPEVREKLRERHLGSGEGKGYAKLYGRHEHRAVAERMLGRALKPEEVVHHVDGNKRNNAHENLRVFSSQSEHARFHAELDWFLKQIEAMEGGDVS